MSNRNFKTRVERLQESTAREKQRFSIRKLSVGAASVLLGTTLFFGTHVSQADAATGQSDADKQTSTDGDSVTKNNADQLKKQDNLTATTQSNTEQTKEPHTTQNTNAAGSNTPNGGVSSDANAAKSADQDSTPSTQEEASKINKNKGEVTPNATTSDLLGSSFDAQNSDESKVETSNNNSNAANGINELSDDTSVEDDSKAQAKTVKVTIKGTMYGDDFTLDIPEGEDIKTAIQNEIDKDNKAQDANQSPLVAQMAKPVDPSTDITGEGVLKDEYKTWKAKKEKEFPLAGYTFNSVSQLADGYTVELIPEKFKYYAGNVWHEYTRNVIYSKYYGNNNQTVYIDKIDGRAVNDTGEWDYNYNGAYYNKKTQNIGTVLPADANSDSTKLTKAEADVPTSKNNLILSGAIRMRRYHPDTGKPFKQSDGSQGGIFVIQYGKKDIGETNSKVGKSWGTLAKNLEATGTTYGDDNTYGLDNYGNGTLIKGTDKNGNQIRVYDPPTVYVIYYHNQPVQVQFEDVTDGDSNAKLLSTFNAPDISWKHSTDQLATRQYSTTVDANGDAVLTDNKADYQADATPYSYKSGAYTQAGELNSDANATKVNAVINDLSSLNFDNILQAYLKNGYALVSEDADDLTYNANNVWSSDPTDTENDGHKLNTITRTIKLKRVAHQVGPYDRTVTRTVHYVKDDPNQTPLKQDTTQSARFQVNSYWVDNSNSPVTAELYKDSDGKPIKDAKGNDIYVVTGTTGMPKWQITTSNPATDVDISSTSSFATFTDKNQDEITDKDGTVWVLNKAESQEANQDTLSTDPTEWDGYSTDDNGKTYTKNLTLVYDQKAYAHTETKQAQRIIHYVADEGEGLSQEKMPELKDSDVQTINFKATYYTIDEKGTGKHVAVKNIGTAEDPIYVVDSTKEPTETWTIDTSKSNNGTDISNDQASYDQVTEDEITNGNLPGTWTVTEATKNNAPKETISNSIENKSEENVYLVYTKNVNADVSFYDVTNGVANKTSIASTITDSDDQGKSGQPIGWTSDPQKTINSLTSQGYVQVTAPDQWSAGLTYGNDDSHYNVYFIHNHTTTPTDKTPEADKKSTEAKQTRRIKYFDGTTGKSLDGQDGVQDKTQTVSWKRTAVYDAVTGAFLGYTKDLKQKDDNGLIKVDSRLTDDNSWVITSTDSDYPEVISPNLTDYGYKSERSLKSDFDSEDNGKEAEQETADPTKDGGEVDIYYFHDTTPVKSTNPKTLGDKINPKGDATYPQGIDQDSLEHTVTRIINYRGTDDNGKSYHEVNGSPYTNHSTYRQSVTFERTAIVDKVTGNLLGYDINGDGEIDKNNTNGWTVNGKPADNYKLDEVSSKTPADIGYDTVDKPTVDSLTVTPTTEDSEPIIVTYNHNYVNSQIKYVDDTTGKDIIGWANDTDANGIKGQAIHFPTNPTDQIKQLENQGYILVRNDFGDGQKYGNKDSQYEVHFVHSTNIVPPSDTPTFPDNAKDKDIKTQVTQQRVIKYFDGDTNESLNGKYGVEDQTQSVTWGRTAIYDAVTGDLLGYAEDNKVSYIMYDKDGKVTTDESKADHKVAKADGDGSWTVTSANSAYPAVNSKDLTANGYKAARSLTDKYDVSDNGKAVQQETADPTKDGAEVDIYYFHDVVPVTPTSTDVPKDKDGKPVVDQSILQKSVSRKIHFVERGTNKQVAKDIDQSVDFSLTAIVDKVTGEVLGYDTTGDNQPDYQDINKAWQNMPAKTLGKTVTPEDYGYDHHDLSTVEGTLVNVNSTPDDVTVEYWNDQGSFKVIYIDQDNNNKPIENTEYDAPTKNFDTSITYKTQKTIDQLKDQGYELVTDGFTGPSGTTYTKDNNGKVFKVILKHTTESVTSKDPKTPGTKITKDGDGKYPQGLDKDSLEVTKSRTITYVDGTNNSPVNGSPNGKSEETQSVTFHKNAIIDRVTGNLLGYDTNGDGQVDTKNSDDAWYTEDSTGKRTPGNKATLNSLTSKTPSKVGYNEYDKANVSSVEVTPTSDLQDEVVKYYHYTPGKPETKTFTRTINYVDKDSGNPIPADKMPDRKNVVTQTITLTRTPYTDHNGNVVGYQVHGEFVPVSETDGWTSDKMPKVPSPNLDDYTPADQSLVSELKITKDSPSESTVTVKYGHQTTSKEVNKDVTRTITYVDRDTNKPVNGSPDGKSSYTQTVHFKMNEIHDAVTKELLGYDTTDDGKVDFKDEDEAWKNVPAQTLSKITSTTPTKVGNYDEVDTPEVTQETVTATSKPADKVVKYWKTPATPTTPVDQKAKVTIIDKTTGKTLTYFTDNHGKTGDPINFDGAKDALASYLDLGYQFDSAVDSNKSSIGQDADSIKYPNFDQDPKNSQDFTIYLIHKTDSKQETGTSTSTVHYVVSDGKTPAPKDSVQTTTWTRTVTTDKITGETTTTPWTPDKSYQDVKTPDLTGYTPTSDNVVAKKPVYGENPYTVVTYNPEKTVDQVAKLRIVDKTANKQLTDFISDHGQAGQGISFSNSKQFLQLLLDKGYVFDSAVQDSDNSSIGKDAYSIKYPNFDQIPKNSQDFTIYLVHGTKEVTSHDKSTAHVHYVVTGNDSDKPQAPADSTEQTINWTKTDTVDTVTGKVIKEGTWTSDKSSFDKVDSPTVTGYTPDKSSAEFTDPVRGEDQPLLVVYTKNPTEPTPTPTPSPEPTPTPTPTPVVPTTPDSYKVTVDYVDEHGNKIKDPIIETNHTNGSSYNTNTKETKPKTITTKDGRTYKLTEVKKGSDQESSTIQGQDVKVTYVYKLVEQGNSTPAKEEHNITVHYVDEHGNEIDKPVTEKGKDGDKYDVTDKKKSTITKDGKTYEYKKTTGDSEEGTVDGKDVNVYYVYYTKLGTHQDKPTNPKKDKKTVKKTSAKTTKFMEEVEARHNKLTNKYRSTVGIHADHVKTPANMPKDQSVDKQGNIINAKGEVIGYMKNGKPHYTTLPQTGEKNENAAVASGLITALLGGITAYGAGRRKKRRH